MSANQQLGQAGGATIYSLAPLLPAVTPENAPLPAGERPVLPDLSVTPEAKQQWRYGYNAWIRVPVSIPDTVSVKGMLRAVNNSLEGRKPLTHRSPDRETFVALFRIADATPETMQEIGSFAVCLARALGPLATGEPTVQVTHFSEPLSEPLVVRPTD